VEKNPGFKSLLSVRPELPDLLAAAIVVPGKLIKEKPEVAQAFVNAKIRGIRYALDHKDETVALVMKVLKTEDKAGMARSFDDHYKLKLFEPDLNFTDKAIQDAQESNIKAGSQKAILPLDKIINRKFVEETLKKLGKYQWR
ncbi:MAG: hypothetical protein Q8P59_10225, partial [Dehalococcoidia bacterium]|nr:hypothetical protein [Dehalococcoidia bacterium]